MAPEAKANGDCYFLRGELGDRRQKGPAGIKVTVTFALTLTFSSPMLSTFCPLYCESLLVLKDKLEGNDQVTHRLGPDLGLRERRALPLIRTRRGWRWMRMKRSYCQRNLWAQPRLLLGAGPGGADACVRAWWSFRPQSARCLLKYRVAVLEILPWL